MKNLLSEPALSGIEIGSTEWFTAQRSIISSRPLIRATYDRWYSTMLADVQSVPPERPGKILEIGSGSGYVKTLNPDVITSDVVPGNSDLVIDAQNLPFEDASLRGILLTHVFHHIPDITRFLTEALRTLVDGGVIAMIDVAHTPLSRLLFGRFHPEDYRSDAATWSLDMSRPYGGANQALTWMLFKRDRRLFEDRFPDLSLETIELLPWLGYLFSGGATRRNLVPNALARVIIKVDAAAELLNPICALHWHIRIRKRGSRS